MFIKRICKNWLYFKQENINSKNRERLSNYDPTIISSNCLGGIMYHWLGLRFNSPFINLFFSNSDFIRLLENFDDFINTEIVEDKTSNMDYPVGIGFSDIRIYFMHYKSFDEAIKKWNSRKRRINLDNAVIMFSNFEGEDELLERFSKLPYKNKIVFTKEKYDAYECAICLPGFKEFAIHGKKYNMVCNVWNTKNYITGERWIDSFDYVGYLNKLEK